MGYTLVPNGYWWRNDDPCYYLYFLRSPDTNLVRYIGISTDPEKRIHSHRAAKNRVGNWVRQLQRTGRKPIIETPLGGHHALKAHAAEVRLIALVSLAAPGQLLNPRLYQAHFFGPNSPILEISRKGGLTPLPTSVI